MTPPSLSSGVHNSRDHPSHAAPVVAPVRPTVNVSMDVDALVEKHSRLLRRST